jgi:hypothetical protein
MPSLYIERLQGALHTDEMLLKLAEPICEPLAEAIAEGARVRIAALHNKLALELAA